MECRVFFVLKWMWNIFLKKELKICLVGHIIERKSQEGTNETI